MVKFSNGAKVMAAVAAALVIGVSAPAMARDADPKGAEGAVENSQAPAEQAKAAPVQRYCVVGAATGTRLPKRVCKTRAEWLLENFDPLAPQ